MTRQANTVIVGGGIWGLTTFAPDGAYLIGPVPHVEGLFAATGCAALGIAGSAAERGLPRSR